ncbi:MAG: EAL domain-containing protein [Trueperaceae bacterium]|nr:MAG: EAL domain-containing protein [Trueperaceae bacterium]
MVSERPTLELELREALSADQFVLAYQTRVRLADDTITSLEALVRWQHPTRGLVGPNQFIPVSSATGMIHEVGDRVLALATGQLAAWRDAAIDPLPVAVNLSAMEFYRVGVVDDVRMALTRHGLPGALLEVEVTETALMASSFDVEETLEAMRALGVRLSVDDFVTAYSSLSRLGALPVDHVNIDQSFVRALDCGGTDAIGERAARLVRAVLGITHSLGLGVIAEGIETHCRVGVPTCAGPRLWSGSSPDATCRPGAHHRHGPDAPAPGLSAPQAAGRCLIQRNNRPSSSSCSSSGSNPVFSSTRTEGALCTWHSAMTAVTPGRDRSQSTNAPPASVAKPRSRRSRRVA